MTPSDLTKENEELKKELAALRAEVERLKDADVVSGVLRMENKKIGGALADICKLLKASEADKRYYDESELSILRQERDAYRGALKKIYNFQIDGTAKSIAKEAIATYPKQKEKP